HLIVVPNGKCSERGGHQEQYRNTGPNPVVSSSARHHRSLWCGPKSLIGQQVNIQILPKRQQMPVLRFGIPDGSTIDQTKFCATSPGLLLIARQPITQCRHKIIMSELIEACIANQRRRTTSVAVVMASAVAGRNQSNFPIEDREQ